MEAPLRHREPLLHRLLPKGNYVFKYSTRVVHKGRYQTGFAGIQCMYAPEFNSHSESIWVVAE